MSIQALLFATAYLASETGRDSYGKPTYETPRAIKVRSQQMRTMIRNHRGEDAASHHRIYTLDPVLLTDRVWLPGANQNDPEQANLPLTVHGSPDGTGSRTIYRVDL